MNYLQLLDTNLVEDMIGREVRKIRFKKMLKEMCNNLYQECGLCDQYWDFPNPWNADCVDYTSYSINDAEEDDSEDDSVEGEDDSVKMFENKYGEEYGSCRGMCAADSCIHCKHYRYVRYYYVWDEHKKDLYKEHREGFDLFD